MMSLATQPVLTGRYRVQIDHRPTFLDEVFEQRMCLFHLFFDFGAGPVSGFPQHANGTFVSAGTVNNAATGAVTMGTIDLSATGTKNNTTFLRGDNTWAAATSTGSPNIDVLDEGVSITTQADSLNFTGAGVTATASGNDVTINIPGASSAVTSIIGGTGITTSAATGNVTVTNSGVTSLVAGTNITLTPSTGLGNVTINATNNPGTVQSVIAGDGLNLESSAGTEISTPTLGVEKNGSNNYIIVQLKKIKSSLWC